MGHSRVAICVIVSFMIPPGFGNHPALGERETGADSLVVFNPTEN